ncbi:MAG: acetyl-CoA carboxylase biotin carboxyl carrier protein [Lentisphaeria bacterium]|nr:acetyl-CoA carboxylase biotin carboxyl carrier protein [Lentisphaeria bacterium]
MKVQEIASIVKLMADNDLTEFKIKAEDFNLCIKRGSNVVVAAAPAIAAAPVAPAPAVAAPAENAAAPAAPKAVDPAKQITSPLVGTFYRSASPDAAPFVQVGSKVSEDTTVCIIEAMKVMNEVKAEKSGTIKEILVDNAQAVEYGQVLFVIE